MMGEGRRTILSLAVANLDGTSWMALHSTLQCTSSQPGGISGPSLAARRYKANANAAEGRDSEWKACPVRQGLKKGTQPN